MIVQLNEKESKALHDFITEYWFSFLQNSKDYIDDNEANELADKLGKA